MVTDERPSLQTKFWAISNDHWVLPVQLFSCGEHWDIRPAPIPMLKAQVAALNNWISNYAMRSDAGEMIVGNETLIECGHPVEGDPEECVRWQPDGLVKPDIPPSEQLLEDVVREGFVGREAATIVWSCFIKHIARRLALGEPVDMIYFKLVPTPLHYHWPLWCAQEFGLDRNLPLDDIIRFLTDKPMKNSWGNTETELRWGLTILSTVEYRRACALATSQRNHRYGGPRKSFNKWVRDSAEAIHQMWIDYIRCSIQKDSLRPSRLECRLDISPERALPLARTGPKVIESITLDESICDPEDYSPEAVIRSLDAEAKRVSEMYDFRLNIEDLRKAGRDVDKPSKRKD